MGKRELITIGENKIMGGVKCPWCETVISPISGKQQEQILFDGETCCTECKKYFSAKLELHIVCKSWKPHLVPEGE